MTITRVIQWAISTTDTMASKTTRKKPTSNRNLELIKAERAIVLILQAFAKEQDLSYFEMLGLLESIKKEMEMVRVPCNCVNCSGANKN